MGDGRDYKCSKCGKEYHTFWGIGYLYPVVKHDEEQKIKKGKYGQEWKELFQSNELIKVDVENHVYLCGKCGYWTVEPGLSLYVPKDGDETITDQKEDEADEGSWGNDRSAPFDLEGYHLLKERVHKCTNCRETMHVATKEEIPHLRCPECGGKPENGASRMILWD